MHISVIGIAVPCYGDSGKL